MDPDRSGCVVKSTFVEKIEAKTSAKRGVFGNQIVQNVAGVVAGDLVVVALGLRLICLLCYY